MNIRRLFSALLIAIMIFIMIPFASAENPLEDTDIVSGTYLGFTYYFNTKTGKLVIRGTGKMPSFENGKAPWSEYSAKATSVVLSKGITSISENAFAGFTALKTISIPETVTEIAATSFTSCEAIEEVEDCTAAARQAVI